VLDKGPARTLETSENGSPGLRFANRLEAWRFRRLHRRFGPLIAIVVSARMGIEKEIKGKKERFRVASEEKIEYRHGNDGQC